MNIRKTLVLFLLATLLGLGASASACTPGTALLSSAPASGTTATAGVTYGAGCTLYVDWFRAVVVNTTATPLTVHFFDEFDQGCNTAGTPVYTQLVYTKADDSTTVDSLTTLLGTPGHSQVCFAFTASGTGILESIDVQMHWQ